MTENELSKAGLSFRRQEHVPIRYKDVVLSSPLRLDVVVADKLILDLKAKQEITDIDKQQLLTYLRLRNLKLGLLMNFHVIRLVDGIHRIVNGL